MALVVRSHGRLDASGDQIVCVVEDSPNCPESERPYIIFRFDDRSDYAHCFDVSGMFADFNDVDEARGLAMLARSGRLTGRPGAWTRPRQYADTMPEG